MKIIMVILSLFVLCGCEKKENTTPPEEVIFNSVDKEYAIYKDEGMLYDLIGDNNVKIISENKKLNTDKLGENKVSVQYTYNDRKYKKELTYNVIDNEAPVFISAPSVRTIKVNDDFYPCDEIVFGDNYDKEAKCEVNNFLDLTQVGEYPFEYTLTDSSGNISTKKATLKVLENYTNNPTTPTRKATLPIEDVIRDKKNEDTMIGIDVSRWQENIDFERVKNAGVEFVIMRFGVNSDIDKDISVDSYFEQNIKNAKAAGLKVGVYCYSAAISEEKAIEMAKWTIDNLNGIELDFPIAFDWENWSKFRKYNISIHELDLTYEAFSKYVNKYGYKSMLYSSKFYLENIWGNRLNDKVWLANYTNKTEYQGEYMLWQMSNTGRVDGINGDVDIDILYKNKID